MVWLTSLCLAVLLGVYYALFVYVPRGTVSPDQRINGIPFRELAGSYSKGHILSWQCLRISSDSRFYFERPTDLGVFDRNKGPVEADGECVRLKPRWKRSDWLKTELVPVKWSDRFYLVARDEVTLFCAEVNIGAEPRGHDNGFLYLRDGDSGKAASGKPSLDAPLRRYLLESPLKGTVTSVLDAETATVSLGLKDGIRPDDILLAWQQDPLWPCHVQVQSVGTATSIVKCRWRSGRDVLREGQTVTQSPPWR